MEEEVEARSARVGERHDEAPVHFTTSPVSTGSSYLSLAQLPGGPGLLCASLSDRIQWERFHEYSRGKGALPGESNLYPSGTTSDNS